MAGTRLLALFGAPVAQEDHAWRALSAAWGLHQRLAADPSRDPEEARLTVCLGLHTGLMVVGGIGEAQEPAAVVGDLLLTVEALQEHAAPGRLLCSAATARLLQRDVRLEEVAPVPVLGQPHPVRTYQVVGLRTQDGSGTPGVLRAHSPFVGRAHELATLHTALAQVMGGRGQVVGIVGEPGIGKSRLLAEWRQQLHARAVTYLEGRCLSYGSATPYLPVRDWLRAHCGITPADGAAAITAKVCERLQAVGLAPDSAAPALLPLLGVDAATVQGAGSSPETLKAHIFTTLRQLWLQAVSSIPSCSQWKTCTGWTPPPRSFSPRWWRASPVRPSWSWGPTVRGIGRRGWRSPTPPSSPCRRSRPRTASRSSRQCSSRRSSRRRWPRHSSPRRKGIPSSWRS